MCALNRNGGVILHIMLAQLAFVYDGWRNMRDETAHLAARCPSVLPQWVEHHKRLGVGRIYVFDHGSELPLNATLRRHIASKLVRYEYSTMGFHNSTGGALPSKQSYLASSFVAYGIDCAASAVGPSAALPQGSTLCVMTAVRYLPVLTPTKIKPPAWARSCHSAPAGSACCPRGVCMPGPAAELPPRSCASLGDESIQSVLPGAGRVSPQLVLYQQCLQRFGRRHRFMAFIDSDEVRCPPNTCCVDGQAASAPLRHALATSYLQTRPLLRSVA